LISWFIDLVLHLDKQPGRFCSAAYHLWIYPILFAGDFFARPGLVVTPFLPGDSLLFAVGRAGRC